MERWLTVSKPFCRTLAGWVYFVSRNLSLNLFFFAFLLKKQTRTSFFCNFIYLLGLLHRMSIFSLVYITQQVGIFGIFETVLLCISVWFWAPGDAPSCLCVPNTRNVYYHASFLFCYTALAGLSSFQSCFSFPNIGISIVSLCVSVWYPSVCICVVCACGYADAVLFSWEGQSRTLGVFLYHLCFCLLSCLEAVSVTEPEVGLSVKPGLSGNSWVLAAALPSF